MIAAGSCPRPSQGPERAAGTGGIEPKITRLIDLGFPAEGIEVSATQAVATANALLALVNADRDRIAGLGRAAASALAVHLALQRQPIATSAALVKATGLTAATVNKSLAHLEGSGIVGEWPTGNAAGCSATAATSKS